MHAQIEPRKADERCDAECRERERRLMRCRLSLPEQEREEAVDHHAHRRMTAWKRIVVETVRGLRARAPERVLERDDHRICERDRRNPVAECAKAPPRSEE